MYVVYLIYHMCGAVSLLPLTGRLKMMMMKVIQWPTALWKLPHLLLEPLMIPAPSTPPSTSQTNKRLRTIPEKHFISFGHSLSNWVQSPAIFLGSWCFTAWVMSSEGRCLGTNFLSCVQKDFFFFDFSSVSRSFHHVYRWRTLSAPIGQCLCTTSWNFLWKPKRFWHARLSAGTLWGSISSLIMLISCSAN